MSVTHLSPTEKALIALSRARVANPSRLAETVRAADFTELLLLSRLNATTVLTTQRLREITSHGFSPPATEEWSRFCADADALIVRGGKRIAATQEILRFCAQNDIPIIPLKGMLLGSLIYSHPDYKKMNDFDFLIRFQDVPRFLAGIRALGFKSVGDLFHDGEVSEKNHHTPPFVNADQSCILGIHWGLCSRHARWRPRVDEIWRDATRTEILGVPAWRMSWEHNLAHLCFHLPFFKIGAREISDVSNLILFASPRLDWEKFLTICREWRIADPAYRVLALAAAYLRAQGDSAQEVEKVLNQFTPEAFTRADTQMRLSTPGLLLRSRSVHVGKVEKAFSVMRLTKNPVDRVAAWALTWIWTFFPKDREAQRMLGEISPRPKISRRLRAGPRVWHALARDYGNQAVLFMTAYNIVYVVGKTLGAPFQKWGPRFKHSPEGKLLELLE